MSHINFSSQGPLKIPEQLKTEQNGGVVMVSHKDPNKTFSMTLLPQDNQKKPRKRSKSKTPPQEVLNLHEYVKFLRFSSVQFLSVPKITLQNISKIKHGFFCVALQHILDFEITVQKPLDIGHLCNLANLLLELIEILPNRRISQSAPEDGTRRLIRKNVPISIYRIVQLFCSHLCERIYEKEKFVNEMLEGKIFEDPLVNEVVLQSKGKERISDRYKNIIKELVKLHGEEIVEKRRERRRLYMKEAISNFNAIFGEVEAEKSSSFLYKCLPHEYFRNNRFPKNTGKLDDSGLIEVFMNNLDFDEPFYSIHSYFFTPSYVLNTLGMREVKYQEDYCSMMREKDVKIMRRMIEKVDFRTITRSFLNPTENSLINIEAIEMYFMYLRRELATKSYTIPMIKQIVKILDNFFLKIPVKEFTKQYRFHLDYSDFLCDFIHRKSVLKTNETRNSILGRGELLMNAREHFDIGMKYKRWEYANEEEGYRRLTKGRMKGDLIKQLEKSELGYSCFVHKKMGKMFFKKKNFRKAVSEYKNAIKSTKVMEKSFEKKEESKSLNDVEKFQCVIFCNIAICYSYLKDYERSLRYTNFALRIDKKHAKSCSIKGIALIRLKKFEKIPTLFQMFNSINEGKLFKDWFEKKGGKKMLKDAKKMGVIECANCGKMNFELRCCPCMKVRYCDEKCQSSHWKTIHKHECKAREKANKTPFS